MKHNLPFVIVSVGLLVLLGASGWLYVDNLIRQPASIALPESLAGLPLTEERTGVEVASGFFNLHEKQFTLTSGGIGFYGGRQITLWVAGTPLDSMASDMTVAMRNKIAEGNSPFAPLPGFEQEGRTIHTLDGMGQKHFYFQSGNLVIWLATDPALAEAALKQTLEIFP